jgi:hypothetical protein
MTDTLNDKTFTGISVKRDPNLPVGESYVTDEFGQLLFIIKMAPQYSRDSGKEAVEHEVANVQRLIESIENTGHAYAKLMRENEALKNASRSKIPVVSAFSDEQILGDLIKEDRLQQMEAHAEESGKFPYPASTVLELIHHIRAVEKVRDEWCMEYVRLRDAPKLEMPVIDGDLEIAIIEDMRRTFEQSIGNDAPSFQFRHMLAAFQVVRPYLREPKREIVGENS